MKLPFLLFADTKGKIYTHPSLRMASSSAGNVLLPQRCELMQMPKGTTLFYLPGRYPIGFNIETQDFEVLHNYDGKEVFAVSAFTVPGIVRLYNPSVFIKKKEILPLWAYTACGFYGGKYYIAGQRIDKRVRQSPHFYNARRIQRNIRLTLKKSPHNRLYQHLSHCALNYNCLAAKNLFLRRWEAPLPTAGACNARCLGCLSDQGSECVASHGRIAFKPSADEIAEVMIGHLRLAHEAIVSFGQGCEGEPLLEADTIVRALARTRQTLKRGTINMNTNASLPLKIKMLACAGMDSFRVSLNSPEKKYYDLYFRPQGYCFKDVMRSIAVAKKHNKFVSINLFVFPGFTDSKSQAKKLISFINSTGVDMIQWRNLNIDPAYYLKQLTRSCGSPEGVSNLIARVRTEFPKLKHGYFNLPKERFFLS